MYCEINYELSLIWKLLNCLLSMLIDWEPPENCLFVKLIKAKREASWEALLIVMKTLCI